MSLIVIEVVWSSFVTISAVSLFNVPSFINHHNDDDDKNIEDNEDNDVDDENDFIKFRQTFIRDPVLIYLMQFLQKLITTMIEPTLYLIFT